MVVLNRNKPVKRGIGSGSGVGFLPNKSRSGGKPVFYKGTPASRGIFVREAALQSTGWLEGSDTASEERIDEYFEWKRESEDVQPKVDNVVQDVLDESEREGWSYGKTMREIKERSMDITDKRGINVFGFADKVSSDASIGYVEDGIEVSEDEEYNEKEVLLGQKVSGMSERQFKARMTKKYVVDAANDLKITPNSLEKRVNKIEDDEMREAVWRTYASRDDDTFDKSGRTRVTIGEIKKNLNDTEWKEFKESLDIKQKGRVDDAEFEGHVVNVVGKDSMRYAKIATLRESARKEVDAGKFTNFESANTRVRDVLRNSKLEDFHEDDYLRGFGVKPTDKVSVTSDKTTIVFTDKSGFKTPIKAKDFDLGPAAVDEISKFKTAAEIDEFVEFGNRVRDLGSLGGGTYWEDFERDTLPRREAD